MTGITLLGDNYNLDLVHRAEYNDTDLAIWLYRTDILFDHLNFPSQAEYDVAKTNLQLAFGGSDVGQTVIGGDLLVIGDFASQGADGKNYRGAFNINLNTAGDGPENEAVGIAFTRITLAGGSGVGSVDFDTFIHLPAPFNRPPHVIGQYVGNVTPGTDPFAVTNVTSTYFDYDGQANALVDVIVTGTGSYIG